MLIPSRQREIDFVRDWVYNVNSEYKLFSDMFLEEEDGVHFNKTSIRKVGNYEEKDPGFVHRGTYQRGY